MELKELWKGKERALVEPGSSADEHFQSAGWKSKVADDGNSEAESKKKGGK